jgi:hypothetical protein
VRRLDVVEPGTETDAFVELVELLPTVSEIIGEEILNTDGRRLVSLFEATAEADRENGSISTPTDWRGAVVAEYHGEPETLYTQRLIRTEQFKFVYNGPDRNQLYDLQADPHDLQNLIDHVACEEIRRDLAVQLSEWTKETDDYVDVERYRRMPRIKRRPMVSVRAGELSHLGIHHLDDIRSRDSEGWSDRTTSNETVSPHAESACTPLWRTSPRDSECRRGSVLGRLWRLIDGPTNQRIYTNTRNYGVWHEQAFSCFRSGT